MIKKNINTKIHFLFWLIVFSFLLRFVVVYFFRDEDLVSLNVNEWHILSQNLIEYKSYSFFVFNDQPIPSVFMPPIYAFFLYLVKIATYFETDKLLYVITFIQIIFSTYSVYLFYQLNQNFFSKNISLANSFIFSIIPLNVYACGQISSINLQIILSLLFLKFLFEITKKETLKNIIFFSISSGLLILTRGEFILIFVLILFFIIFYKKVKFINLVKITLMVLLIISPYVVRNYIHFNQIVIVKSLGYNLWKGNNELSPVEGYANLKRVEFIHLRNKLNNLEKSKTYEINRDNIFLDEAINNINRDSFRYFKLFFKKIFSYYFIDFNSKYPNYYNLFHIFPIFLVSVLSFPGLFIFYKKNKFENKCLGIYLFSNLVIFSIFFILPRYKLAILPVQIILAVYFIIYIMRKYGFK